MLLTIQAATNEAVAPGMYEATFVGVGPFDTAKGKAWKWTFKTKDGKLISEFSDANYPPTTKNKTGRWLAALANAPCQAGTNVNIPEYVGRNYMLIIVAKEGGSKLETFTQLKGV